MSQAIEIQVFCYGALKDYFPDSKAIKLPSGANSDDLLTALKKDKPDATSLLQLSRIAVSDIILNEAVNLNTGDEVHILPPSSGG